MAIAALLLCSTLVAGRAAASSEQRVRGKAPKRAASAAVVTPPTFQMVTMRDPVENAYTMSMPKGWNNVTYTARMLDVSTIVDVAVSPNGSVVIWQGDPGLPRYTIPEAATEMHHFMSEVNKKMRIEPFEPAVSYFAGYVRKKFGRLPGFVVTSIQDDPEVAQQTVQRARNEYGMDLTATAANVDFRYTERGKTIRARILGMTSGGSGVWSPTVVGVATLGDPKTYLPMMSAMGKTRKMNPQWQAAQQRKHEEAMARIQAFGEEMTANHNANMARLQQSAQAHQSRMSAIRAQGDASTKAYYSRMASGDLQQRRFLNYINDENTVVGGSGKAFQVDGSYERYFLKKGTNTYIGGDRTMTLDALRRLNLDPNDYEEAKIRK